jgi:hypothetical protein
MEDVVIKRALLSVSDKTGLVELGHALAARHVELVSTGGTAKTLRDAGLAVTDISELTGFPEMMDGRVKTLHPKVHGGLLAVRDNPEHAASMKEHDIGAIDLVVVNLYPFAQTVEGASRDEIIENIDIGGPSMVAVCGEEPCLSVAIVTDPADYGESDQPSWTQSGVQQIMISAAGCAAKAYSATATYDSDDQPVVRLCRPAAGCSRYAGGQRKPQARRVALWRKPASEVRRSICAGRPAWLAVSHRPSRCRARSCPIIITTTPMQRLSLSANSVMARRRW